jgi:hypothetical protein
VSAAKEALTNSPVVEAQRTKSRHWTGDSAQAKLSGGEASIQGGANPVQKVANEIGPPEMLNAGIVDPFL